MRNKKKALGVIFFVIACLSGILFWLYEIPNNSDEVEEGGSVYKEYISLGQEFGEIISICVKKTDGDYTIKKIGEKKYAVEELNSYEQNHERCCLVVKQILECKVRKVSTVGDLGEYGLEKPQMSLVVRSSEGTDCTIYVGEKVGEEEFRYLLVGEKIFVLEKLLDILVYSVEDYVSMNLIPPCSMKGLYRESSESETYGVEIFGGKLQESIGDNSLKIVSGKFDNDLKKYGFSGETFYITHPIEAELDMERARELISILTEGFTARNVYILNPTAQQREACGFSGPYASVRVNRGSQSYVISVGNRHDNESRYVMSDSKEVIYIAENTEMPWISVDINSVFFPLLVLPDIDRVSGIEVEIYDETYDFFTEYADGKPIRFFNGKKISEEKYKIIYQFILSASAEAVDLNMNNSEEEKIAQITYRYFASDDDIISFYRISDRRIAISLNGKGGFVMREAFLRRLKENMHKVDQNEEIIVDY